MWSRLSTPMGMAAMFATPAPVIPRAEASACPRGSGRKPTATCAGFRSLGSHYCRLAGGRFRTVQCRHCCRAILHLLAEEAGVLRLVSPSRGRGGEVSPKPNGHMVQAPANAPSIISFAAEVRRAKKGENRIEEAHILRLLDNRHLQWRCINARPDAALLVQSFTAEGGAV